MCGSTYNGLVWPSDWLSDKITVIDVNWFERMSKRKLNYQPICSTFQLILTLVCLGIYFTNTATK